MGTRLYPLIGCSLPFIPKGKNEIYICMDGDEAGKSAAFTISKDIGFRSKVVQLPDDEDPNNFFQSHNKGDFENLLLNAKDFITVQVEGISSDMSKIDLSKRLDPIIEQLKEIYAPTVESYLSRLIKPRFQLNTHELQAYRKQFV